jgi:hypothetical protein
LENSAHDLQGHITGIPICLLNEHGVVEGNVRVEGTLFLFLCGHSRK